MAARQRQSFAATQRGLSLIEMMVGLLIGLLTTLVVAQVLKVAEGQKRSTTSGSDAQVNGALALYALRRDIEMSGYGLITNQAALGCTIKAKYQGTSFTWTLAPANIVAGTAGAPDQIQILSGNKDSYSVPALINMDHPATAANFFVNSTLGIAVSDLMLAVPETWDAANWCTVIEVTNATSGQVIHNSGSGGPWNQPGGSNIFPVSGYPAGSYLLNLGQLVARTYSISSALALRQDTLDVNSGTLTGQDSAPQIVQLQGLYGKDTNGDGLVDTYDKVSPTDAAGWAQVRSMRIAVVARSAQKEREQVTFANPLWDVGNVDAVAGTASCGSSKCLTLKVDTVTDWQYYRYKTYDTVIPLRNILWNS